MQLSENFTLDELTNSATAKISNIENTPDQDELFNLAALSSEVLQPCRDLLGVPLSVTSGYRCKALNDAIGGAEDSQHTKGEAADFIPKGMNVLEAARMIANSTINFDQCIYERNENGTEWIHISHVADRRANRNVVLNKIAGQEYVEGLPDEE